MKTEWIMKWLDLMVIGLQGNLSLCCWQRDVVHVQEISYEGELVFKLPRYKFVECTCVGDY